MKTVQIVATLFLVFYWNACALCGLFICDIHWADKPGLVNTAEFLFLTGLGFAAWGGVKVKRHIERELEAYRAGHDDIYD